MSEFTIFLILLGLGFVILFPMVLHTRKLREQDALLEAGDNPPASAPIMQQRPIRQSAPAARPQSTLTPPPPPAAPAAPSDPRTRTLLAMQQLPQTVEPHPAQGNAIPLMQGAGQRWYGARIGEDGHWGVFGSSGAGKGNVLQLVALEALRLGPERLRLVVLDPKDGLDYGFCRIIQHAELYTSQTLTAGYAAMVAEMRRRNQLMAINPNVTKIDEYEAATGEQLPRILIIADEVAELDKEQREYLATLARVGRAAGIVLFVATQYPTVDALPNQIQSNVLNRLVLRLSSSSYTSVALRRVKDDNGTYEPSAISRSGVAVLRRDGGVESLGVVPRIGGEMRANMIECLRLQWPKESESMMLDGRLEPLSRTGSEEPNGQGFEAEPVAVPELVLEPMTAVLADTTAVRDDDAGLPKDEVSQMIRVLVRGGISRNKIASNLIGGARAEALKRIKIALGEVELLD